MKIERRELATPYATANKQTSKLINPLKKNEFKKRFHVDIESVYGNAIDRLVSEKLLLVEEDRIKLTALGIDVSNRVFANFLL